jgi:probable F420-dependent oxidoreductase
MVEFGVLLSGNSAGDAVERAVAAEAMGYDSVFVGHHRFTPGFGFTIHPGVLLSAIAARTTRLKLGTSIFLLPTDHPLDVAEEFASLDVLSGGRLIFGPGLGYREYEYAPLGLPYHERGALMAECLEVLQRVWAEESVTHHGKYFHFDDVTVTPRPVQSPRPPIWIGANSDRGMERAATLADGWIVGFADRLPKLLPRLAEYRAVARANGRAGGVCLMRLVGIGRSREEVARDWLPTVISMLRGYRKVGAPAETKDAQADALRRAQREEVRLEDLGSDMFVAGDPEDCFAAVRRCLDETGCEHFLASFGGADPDAAMQLFAEEVIPRFSS